MPQIVQDDITGLTHEFPDDVTPEEVEEALNKESSSFMRRALGDTGISLLQGAVGAAESAVGLLNIPTGGYAGKAMEDMFGANFQASRKFLEESKTSEQQQANRNVQEAEGFWDTVGAGIKNPSSIVGSIAESVASTIGAGGVGRGVVGLGRRFAPVVTEVLGTAAPAIAGAIGEGVISTGSAAEQIRQENDDRLLSPKQIALAIGSGATTSIIGILGGRMASKLGVGDIDALASGAVSSGAKKSILKRAADAVVSSGIEGLEELGQSANEKAAQNIALNKPWSEGVAEAAASGMLAGIGMGIGGGILHGSGSDAPTFDARADRVARNLQDPRYAQIYYGPAKVVAPEMPQGTRYGFEDLNDEELRELYRRSRIEYSNSPSSELGGSIKRIEFEIKQRTNPTPSQTVDIANLQEVTDAATLASIKETAAKDAEARAAADAAMGPPEAAAVEQPKVAPEMGIKPSVADLGLMTPDEAIQAGVDRGSYYVAVTDAFRNEKITESEYRLRAEIDPSKWPSVKAGDDVYVPRWNDSGKVMNVGYGWMDVLNKKGKITKQNADLELLSEWNKRREDEANILPVAQPPPPAAPPKAAAVEHDAELTDTSGKLKDGELGIGDGYGWVIDGYEFHGDVVEVGDGWRKIKLDNGNSVVKITFVDSEPKVAPEMGIKPSVTVEYMKEVGRLPLDTLADELHALGAGENTWISKHSPRDAQGFASNSLPSRQDLERLHGKRFTDTELSMLQQAYEDGRAIDFDAPPAAPPKAAAAEPTAEAGKPVVEPGQGGVPYYRKLGGYDAADPSRKRMRPVPQNFKLAYLDGWYEAKKAKPAAPGAAAQKPVVTSVPETVELNELRITKEQRGLGRLNLERLAELEAKEKAGTLDNPPAAPGATAQKMPWEKAQEVAKTFTPFTPEAKLTFPSRGVYQIDSPVAKIIGQVEGVYIRDKIDESAGSVFIVEATEHKKGGGTLVFKDAVRYLQSIGKTKVVLQGIHTEGGKALIAKMVRDGVIGKQIDKFDSATQVHDITKPDLKPTPPSATGSAAQKMAWEMTRDEYHNYNAESIISDYEGGGTERRGYGATEKLKPMSEAEKTDIRNDREFSDRNRRSTVEAALREGKPVPESVLADYPDIKPAPTAATGATISSSHDIAFIERSISNLEYRMKQDKSRGMTRPENVQKLAELRAQLKSAKQSTPTAETGVKIEIRKGEVGGMLSSEEVVLTSSGRKTTPFPQIKTDTNRKATATVKQVDAWLRDNAIEEARSRNDDFNASQFEIENPAKMPQASKDSMEEYLFGHQPVVPKPFLNPVTPPPPVAPTAAKPNDRVFSEDYKGPRWTYGLRNRPMAIGAQPKGYIIGSGGPAVGRARNGTIQYPRELTAEELYDFEMELMESPKEAPKNKARKGFDYPHDLIEDIKAVSPKISMRSVRIVDSRYKPSGSGELFSNTGGSNIDEVLDGLHREGKQRNIETPDELLSAIDAAYGARAAFRSQTRIEKRGIRHAKERTEDFNGAALEGKRKQGEPAAGEPIPVSELNEGSVFEIAGEKVTVKALHFDEETTDLAYVELEDGRRFDVQTVGSEELIHPDKGTLVQKDLSTDFAPEEPPVAPIPKLRSGENQGDVFANQTEDFALVGEKATDGSKAAEAKAKAERDAAEAKALQDKQQQDLFNKPPSGTPFGSKNTIVTTERANELIARMKAKLKQGPKNVSMLGTGGIDPSLFSDAVQLGAYYIEGGWHKFVDWIAKLREHFTAEELSDKHLRSIYATARITIESPIGQDRSKQPPGLQPGLRPPAERIVIARPEFTKQADESIIPKEIAEHLDPHQRQGVATALKSLLERGGFLLADGTGAGKTRQALAVAEHYAKQGHRVIIVTKSETIKQNWKKNTFGGSYAYDSGKMGIKLTLDRDGLSKPGSIGITTYENLNQVANRTDSNTVLIFDESHALKNDSQRAKKGLRAIAEAKAVMFMSATPADKAEHIYYLARMGVMEGKSVQQALKDLGMKLVTMDKMVKGNGGWSKRTVTFWAEDQNISEADRNKMFSSLFDRLTAKGAMIKREISMEGTHVQVLKIALPPEAHDAMARELTTAARAYHLPANITTDDLNGLRKALVLGNQRRQLEPYKIASAVILAQRELAAGRQVVIFVSRVNESESGYNEKVKTFSGETETVRHVSTRSEGTAKLLREALEDVGIHDIAEIHGNSDQGSLEAMADYQAGKKRVVVATVESGGTGINLDDTVGNKPRTIIMVTAPFDAVGNVQAAGRIWRLKTLSGANIFYLLSDTSVDDWNADIIGSKMAMLGAVVEGQVRRLDISNPESVTTDDFSEKVQSRDSGGSELREPGFGATTRYDDAAGNNAVLQGRKPTEGELRRLRDRRTELHPTLDEAVARRNKLQPIAAAIISQAPRKADGAIDFQKLTTAQIDAIFDAEQAAHDLAKVQNQITDATGVQYPPHFLYERLHALKDRLLVLNRHGDDFSNAAEKGIVESKIRDAQARIDTFGSTVRQSRSDVGLWDYPNQEISSADTSLSQVPATFKKVDWVKGTVNADIGGGRYDNATDALELVGVENLVYDPFNRTKEHNDSVSRRIRNGGSDTATVNNVLNVIKDASSRDLVIRQAANAIGNSGKAYFLIYEGDSTGIGKATTKGFQNNRKAESYLIEIQKRFANVSRKGNLIEASGALQSDSSIGSVVANPISEQAATQAVLDVLGVTELPENIRFINDPSPRANKGEATYIKGQLPQITINLAKHDTSDSIKDTLVHELLHPVQDDPALASAVGSVAALVQEADLLRKQAIGYDENETQIEATNELIRKFYQEHANSNIFQRAVTQVIIAAKRIFGIELTAKQASVILVQDAVKNHVAKAGGATRFSKYSETASQQDRQVPEGRVVTERNGIEDTAPGFSLGRHERDNGVTYAELKFEEAGIPTYRGNGDLLFVKKEARDVDHQVELDALLRLVKDTIRISNELGDYGSVFLQSVREMVAGQIAQEREGRGVMFTNRDVFNELANLSYSYFSNLGKRLSMMARNSSGGELLDILEGSVSLPERLRYEVLNGYFGGIDSDAIQKIIDVVKNQTGSDVLSDTDVAEFLKSLLLKVNRQYPGGTVYKLAHKRLSVKEADSLKKLLSKAKVQEAVQFIIELAKRNGVDEPPQKTKQLTPPEKLFAMVNEKHVDAINASLFEAIRQAERNAARAVWIKEESPDEDAIALYDSETEVAGTSDVGPTQEQVEAGLDDPKFAHWRVVRDSLLGYSPVTDKLIQKVIQWDIKGTDFSDPNAPKQVDSREIDLGKLSIAPDEEVDRVFQAYLDKLEEQMDLNGATQTTKDRIRASIQAKLDDQLAMVRAKKLNIFFNPVTRVASTATGKLGALINLGIDADARYKDSPSLNRLLQKIASKFASVEDMDELARKSRSEKFAAVRDAVEDALSEANISDTNTEFQAYARQVAFNHIATRLFNAESGIVRSVTDSKDVLFGPKAPKTKEEQARIRGDQLQALHDSIEAGVADTVTMDSLARKKLLNQLTPKLTELIKLLATLPISEQNAKADLFVATVMSELGVIDPANVDKVAGSLKRAFIRKLDAAKQSAVEAFLKEKITAVKKPGVLDGVRKLVNSGFFTDSRLSDPDFVSKVASKGAITRLLPNIKEIIKTVLATPVKNQKELGRVFADELAKKLGIDPSQVAGAAAAFAKAYKDKFEKARESSLKAAGNALYPKEREILFANNNKLWEKISDFVRSGGLDDNEFFREFARSKWGDKRVASDRDIAKLRDLVDRIEQLTQLTSKETLRAGSDPARIATAKKERARVQAHSIQLLQRRIEAMMKEWSSPTADNVLDWIKDPVLRRNRNAALNELASSNVLLGVAKFGRQLFDTLTFQPWYVGHRAISNTFNGFLSGVAGGANPSSIQLFKNLSSDLAGVLRVRIATIGHPLRAFSQAVKGRGLPTHVDNLKSGMLMAERLNIRAQELQDKGTPASIVRSYLMRFWALQTLGHRQFGAIDVLQAKSAEWQEMLSQVRAGLRAKGVSKIEINEQSDSIFSNISSDLITARDDAEAILTSATNTPSKSEINAQAWELLQTRLYARIKAIGLNADQFEERNAAYTSTIAWNRPPGGLGGIIAKNMKAVQKWAEPGMPLPTMMFGNAIGTSLNRGMTWIGMGLFPGMFKDDPWYETDVDKLHRKMEAITGVAMQTALGSLVLMGYIIVRLGWPKDKKEREEWQAKGIKPFTIEFPLGDGTNLAIPLRVGPLAPMAGGLAGAAAMRALIEKKHKEQQKLNDDASKLGVEPGKATPINAADLLAVAGKSAWEMLSSGRTASGMLGTYSDYGNMNVGRIVSALASPLIPLLPAYQELTRLAGINIDANIGSFWDMLVPSPWSPSKRVNMLGDSVATPGDLERILGIVTLGGGVTRDIKSDNTPYASLYQTGARPQAISRTKGYNFGVEIRPMTKSELAEFAVSRGVNLKSALADLGPIDGMSPADAKKAVQYAIRTSDNRALASMGITVKQASSRASSGIKTARRRSMRSTSARSSSPYSKKMKTFRHRSLRPSSYKRYNPRRSRGLSRSRNLATPLM